MMVVSFIGREKLEKNTFKTLVTDKPYDRRLYQVHLFMVVNLAYNFKSGDRHRLNRYM